MNTFLPRDKDGHSIGQVLGNIGTSAQTLIQSEINLARAEMKDSVDRLGSHAAQVAVFAALTSLSVLPFIAFLVIGLGKIMGDNYWASSLIVFVVCTSLSGSIAYSKYQKMTQDDFSLPKTREKFQTETANISEHLQDAKEKTMENLREIKNAAEKIDS